MTLRRRATPKPQAEHVVFTGKNAAKVVDLVERVAELGVWGPLDSGVGAHYVRDEEPHLGLCIENADGVIVARLEKGNALVFDPDVEKPDQGTAAPLFVLSPDELSERYEVD